MVEKMQITSDVRQKLNKIRNGDTFESPYVFITELLQNSYRAGAKTVNITVGNNTFVAIDDGCGCRTPKPVLTLDYSEWTSTDEGFGIGFWSVLAIPGLTEVVVDSKTWQATVDVNSIFVSGIPEAIIEKKDVPTQGFAVGLDSEFFGQNADAIYREIRKVGELQPFDIYVNGVRVPKRDIKSEVTGDFVRDYTTGRFVARLAVAENTWETPELYYERRRVCSLHDISGVSGIVEMSPKAITLREPDRKTFTHNDKYDRFLNTLTKSVQDLYIGFIQNADPEKIDRFASVIDKILSVDQYEKYVTLGDEEIEDEIAEIHDEYENAPVVVSGAQAMAMAAEQIAVSPEMYARPNATVVSNPLKVLNSGNRASGTLVKDVAKGKKRVWVKASELDTLSELKAKAEYYGLKVFVANNILQEKIFKKHAVPHLSELENGVQKTNIISNCCIKTQKEASFMRMMERICAYYTGVVPGTIQIADLKLVVETRLDGKLFDKETKKVGGLCYDRKVYLDRKTLGLNRFHLYGSGVGQHELKALMANLTTIAHELAHRLYGTTDNTVIHYKAEEQIRKEIVELFINL
jgi:hypothetical protein